MSATGADSSATDAEDSGGEGVGCSPRVAASGPGPTQHKTTEGPLEGSADLTFTVPIIKVSQAQADGKLNDLLFPHCIAFACHCMQHVF